MEIQSEGINITTVEDPVEYQIPGINQVQMHDDIGLNFSSSLTFIAKMYLRDALVTRNVLEAVSRYS